MGGVNLRTVQTLLGHKGLRMTMAMTMRYSHLSREDLREAVQNLDKSFTLKEGNRENAFQKSIP
jgi:site-specific recombinase XerD